MLFKVLSLLLATALLTKATIALASPHRFYAIRRRQYATASLPLKLLIAPALVLALTTLAVYAALYHYRPFGWVIVGFLLLLSAMGVDHVFRWQAHRIAMLKIIDSPKVWQIDCVLLALGATFGALGVLVY